MKFHVATPDEEGWINERYDEVGFQHSDLTRDLQVIAEEDGQRVGMGRLVTLAENAVELGGMLVFDPFRGRGVAKKIIAELLRHAGDREVYCIPFLDLEPIYAGAGFTRVETGPEKALKKVEWCERTYPRGVVLMRLGDDSPN
ncbi:MAG TPA: GNAT family N-acetyltransferase [Thermoanaerobaculia bacterium]